jgi:hypothetical protein
MALLLQTIFMTLHALKSSIAIWPAALPLVLTACIRANLAPASATVLVPTPAVSTPTLPPGVQLTDVTETGQCLGKMVPPTITDVKPAEGAPGSEIQVIGSGGYLRDACGGYNESAKTFNLYIDNELAGELQCYVNHCEGKITLSTKITPGNHCLSVQKDVCEIELHIAER